MKLPTDEELQALRKGLRKRKLPQIFDGMWLSEPGIGGIKLTASGSDYLVEWVSFENEIKSELKNAMWSHLCTSPELEKQRLEIGFVVSAALEAQADKAFDAIGHPMTAFEETKPYRDAAKEWRHWALVKPGHMLGLS